MSEQIIKQLDEKYCESCGSIIKKAAELCPKCGVRQIPVGFNNGGLPNVQSYQAQNPAVTNMGPGKDWLTAFLLCWFLGLFGAHRFYTGHTAIGIVQLFTLGCCGVWAFIDFIIIITGHFVDVNGQSLVRR